MAPKAVHFGAGNIGRGFVACFLHNSGYEVIFADVADSLIDNINATPEYHVIEVGAEGTTRSTITNYRAINSKTHLDELVEEIRTADIVTCSVGPNILRFIAPVIAQGIDRRSNDESPLHVIACENAIGATDTLAGHIKANTAPEHLEDHHKRARYANSAIDRIVPAQDADAGLDVTLEKFFEWVVDKTPFEDVGIPPIEGINWVNNLQPFIERKLFTVNTSHATAAYFAYYKGIKTIHEAMADKEIRQEVHEALEETAHLISGKHGITPEEQQKYVDTIISRISNPHLEDVPVRVGRAPLRKLGRKERFIGPAAQLAERGYDVTALIRGVEYALRFQNVEGDDESKELAEILSTLSADEATTKLTGLEKEHPLYEKVLAKVKLVQSEKK